MRGWAAWGGLIFLAGCSGRVDVLGAGQADTSAVGNGIAGTGATGATLGAAGTSARAGSSGTFGGSTSLPGRAQDSGTAGQPIDAGASDASDGIPTDASVGVGGDASFDGGLDGSTSAVVNDAPDQTPSADSCGGCAASEVCNPGVGCEPACDVSTGLDPNAAWPVGGGCATRRGLSRFSGPKAGRIVFNIPLIGSEAPYSSAITLGPNREIYLPATDATYADGFMRIARDGTSQFFPDAFGEVPVLAQTGNLFTVPASLLARSHAGVELWSTPSESGSPLRIADQMGEPVIGADGTIYAPGIIDDSAPDQSTGLIAVSPSGDLLWGLPTGIDAGTTTWPAIAADGTIYFGDANGALWAVSPQGQKKWSVPLGEYGWGYPSIDHAQNVFIGNGPELWSFKPDGTIRFHKTMTGYGDQFVFQHFAIAPNGTVFATYYNQNRGGVIAVSNDGEQLWAQTYTGEVAAPVVDRDGTLFLQTTGVVWALSGQGEELWSSALPGSGLCDGGLAIGADGTLFVVCGGLTGFRDLAQ